MALVVGRGGGGGVVEMLLLLGSTRIARCADSTNRAPREAVRKTRDQMIFAMLAAFHECGFLMMLNYGAFTLLQTKSWAGGSGCYVQSGVFDFEQQQLPA